jgi:hypothetical protein
MYGACRALLLANAPVWQNTRVLEGRMHRLQQQLLYCGVATFAVLVVLRANEVRAASSYEWRRCAPSHEHASERHPLKQKQHVETFSHACEAGVQSPLSHTTRAENPMRWQRPVAEGFSNTFSVCFVNDEAQG